MEPINNELMQLSICEINTHVTSCALSLCIYTVPIHTVRMRMYKVSFRIGCRNIAYYTENEIVECTPIGTPSTTSKEQPPVARSTDINDNRSIKTHNRRFTPLPTPIIYGYF